MFHSALPMVIYAAFEFVGFAAAASIHAAIKDVRVQTRAADFAGVLAIKLFIVPLFIVFAFFLFSDRIAAIGIVGAVLCALALQPNLRPVRRVLRLPAGGFDVMGPKNSVFLFAVATAIAYLTALSVFPIMDIDSHHTFNSLAEWIFAKQSPYNITYQYVSFLESSFIPALVLTGEKSTLFLVQFQILTLLAVAVYMIAREAETPPALAMGVVSSLVLLPNVYIGASGVSSLKNDLMANAGICLIALALTRIARREPFSPLTMLLLGIGLSFATIKYNGLAWVVIAGIAAVSFSIRAGYPLKQVSLAAAAMFVLLLLSTGHYYLKNLILYGNPVYPVVFRIFGLSLNGWFDVRGTSIWSHLGDPQLWKILTGRERAGMHRLGIVAPIVIAAFPAIVILIAARAKQAGADLIVLTAVTVVGWVLYMVTPWSAGIGPGPGEYLYINNFGSLRYATAMVPLTLLCASLTAVRLLSVRPVVPTSLLFAHALSQIFVLADDLPTLLRPPGATVLLVAGLLGCLSGAAFFLAPGAAVRRRGLSAAASVGVVLVCTLAASRPAFRANALYHPTPYDHAAVAIDALHPSRVLMASIAPFRETKTAGMAYHAGSRMIVPIKWLEFPAHSPATAPRGEDGDVLVFFDLGVDSESNQSAVYAVGRVLEASGWQRVYVDAWATIFVWVGAGRSPPKCPKSNIAQDVSGNLGCVRSAGVEVSTAPGVELTQLGDGLGLTEEQFRATIVPQAKTCVRNGDRLAPGWRVESGGKRVRIAFSDGRLQILSDEAAPWLALVWPVSQAMANTTITVYALVDSPNGRTAAISLYDFTNERSYISKHVRLKSGRVGFVSHRFGAPVNQKDYVDVGFGTIAVGEWLRVEDICIVEGAPR